MGKEQTYLVDIEDLTSGLLHLAHLVHEVPESGLSSDLVASEQLHSVSRRVLIGGGRGLAADHLVQLHLRIRKDETKLEEKFQSLQLHTSMSIGTHTYLGGHLCEKVDRTCAELSGGLSNDSDTDSLIGSL